VKVGGANGGVRGQLTTTQQAVDRLPHLLIIPFAMYELHVNAAGVGLHHCWLHGRQGLLPTALATWVNKVAELRAQPIETMNLDDSSGRKEELAATWRRRSITCTPVDRSHSPGLRVRHALQSCTESTGAVDCERQVAGWSDRYGRRDAAVTANTQRSKTCAGILSVCVAAEN